MEKLTDLQQAVIEQMGYNELTPECATTLKDVMRSREGAAAGFTGFIYYSETCKFFDDNKKLIIEELQQDAQDLGCPSITDMVCGFNCLKDVVNAWEVENVLIFDSPDDENETTIKNALAWYALEQTAYKLEEVIDEILNNDETEEA